MFVFCIFAVLIWRILAIGYSHILYGEFSDVKRGIVYEKVLRIYPQHLGALFKLADRKHGAGEYEKSNQYLFRALKVSPDYGRAMALLLKNFSIMGESAKESKAAFYAVRLAPAHSYVRGQLLTYWLLKGNSAKIFEELSVLLTRESSLRSYVYTLLDKWVASEENRLLFVPYMQNPPKWWNNYFSYLSRKKNNLDVIEFFYKERISLSKDITEHEEKIMIARLIREKKWTKAYELWLASLSPDMKKYNKLIFDGGFESGLKNKIFTWNFRSSKIYTSKISSTYGVAGRKALHIKFKQKKRVNFINVFQRIFLPSGRMKIGFKVRIDNNIGEKGLKWRLRCAENNEILGETEAFITRKSWHSIVLEAIVPAQSCSVQLLRLEAVSKFAHYQVFSGSLWFDDIKILEEGADL